MFLCELVCLWVVLCVGICIGIALSIYLFRVGRWKCVFWVCGCLVFVGVCAQSLALGLDCPYLASTALLLGTEFPEILSPGR